MVAALVVAGSIMALVVTLGYLGYGEYLGGKGDDLTFGKYDGIFKGDTVFPTISAWYVLPPLALLSSPALASR